MVFFLMHMTIFHVGSTDYYDKICYMGSSSTIKGKTVYNNPSTNNSNSSSIHNYSCEPNNFSTGSNSKFVYNPGRNNLDTKDGLMHNDSDSASSCNMSPAANIHHSLNHN